MSGTHITMGRTALSLLAAAIATPLLVRAHPICYYGARNPVLDYDMPGTFCESMHSDPDGFCCDETEELAAEARYATTVALSEKCGEFHKKVSSIFIVMSGLQICCPAFV